MRADALELSDVATSIASIQIGNWVNACMPISIVT